MDITVSGEVSGIREVLSNQKISPEVVVGGSPQGDAW